MFGETLFNPFSLIVFQMLEKQKTIDQFKAEAFLEDFVKQLAARFGNEIDFILLFGSAAR